jgi:hypothetical protein
VSKFEIVTAVIATSVVDAQDENQARTSAWKNLDSKLPIAAAALGAKLELDEIVASEPVPEASRNEAEDAEPFYRSPRFKRQA